jgi:hypothetical protein
MCTGSSTAIVPVHGSSPQCAGECCQHFSGKFCAIARGGRLAQAGYFRPLRLCSLCIAQSDRSFGTEA